jgi:hypothetical protein
MRMCLDKSSCCRDYAVLLFLQGNRQLVQQVATSGLDVFAHNVETVERLQSVVRDRRANWKQSLGVLAAAKDAGASITKTSIMLGCGEHKEEVGAALEAGQHRGCTTHIYFVLLSHACMHGLLQTGLLTCFAGVGRGTDCAGALGGLKSWLEGRAHGHCTRLTLSSPLLSLCVQVLEAFRVLRQYGVDVVTLGQYMRPTKRHMAVEEYVTPAAFEAYQQAAEQMGFLYVASGPMVRSSYRAGELYLKNALQARKSSAQPAAVAAATA